MKQNPNPKYKIFLEEGAASCQKHGYHSAWYFWAKTNSIQCEKCRLETNRVYDAKRRKQNKFNYILRRLKLRSKQIPDTRCDLTTSFLESLCERQNGKCALSGTPFDTDSNRMSVDRIDSSIGYLQSNVQLVTTWANFMKLAASSAEFKQRCLAIANYEPK